MSLIVISGDRCSKCEELKRKLDLVGVKYSILNMFSTEGMKYVVEFGIKSIPSVIVDGGLVDRSNYKDILGVTLD